MNVEGKNPVRELLDSDSPIEKIMFEDGNKDPILRSLEKLARDKGVKVEFVERRGLDRVSTTGHHQGVIASQGEYKYFALEDVLNDAEENGKEMLFIILDEVSDPHNLGSVIRVAECAGATGVIISGRRSASVNETVIRSSAGATAYVPVIKVPNINQAIEKLKDRNVWVYALDMDGTDMCKTDLTGNVALVVGSEGNGVKSLTRKLCDGVVQIPMFGKINSLNASVSAGIVTYECLRQRRK